MQRLQLCDVCSIYLCRVYGPFVLYVDEAGEEAGLVGHGEDERGHQEADHEDPETGVSPGAHEFGARLPDQDGKG